MATARHQELQQRASTLRAEATALTVTYRRTTWLRFALVFIPIPFVLVLLRLQIEAWHYVLFGAAYIGCSAWLYVIDGRASAKCNSAPRAADEAQTQYREPSSLIPTAISIDRRRKKIPRCARDDNILVSQQAVSSPSRAE